MYVVKEESYYYSFCKLLCLLVTAFLQEGESQGIPPPSQSEAL